MMEDMYDIIKDVPQKVKDEGGDGVVGLGVDAYVTCVLWTQIEQ